jgi:hypothetical protein
MNSLQKARALIKITTGLMIGFTIIQTFPIWQLEPSMDPRNPPVRYQVEWASPEADHIMEQVCYTCHSNETEYPIYMRIAPLSWIAAQHVNEGRAHLNFSEQSLDTVDPNVLVAMIQADVMPPQAYRLTHPEANLTDAQKERLIQSILATFKHAEMNKPTAIAQLRTATPS